MKKLRILLIDDNPDDRILAVRELRREFKDIEIEQIAEAEDLSRALNKKDFDLVITDYQLRWTNGIAVLQVVKSRWPDCPVIMFTGTGSEEIAAEAMKAGLSDYIVKSPKHFARLPIAVKSALEQMKQRKAMRNMETRYRSLFDGAPVGLYRLAPDGRLVEANLALVNILGYPNREILLATNLLDSMVDPEARDRWRMLMERHGMVDNFEVRMMKHDGSIIWVKNSSKVVRGADERVMYYEGCIEDITARKQTEDELRKTRNRAQKYLDVAGVILVALNERGEITLINRRGCRILGYNEEELLGKNWFDVCLPERERAKLKSMYEKWLAGGLRDFEYWENAVLTRSGERRIIAWHNIPLYDDRGVAIGTLSSGEDITERKRAERELQRSLDKLRRAMGGIIQAMALTVETRDPYTAGHQRRVADLARAIATEMGLSEERIDGIRMAGVIHDLGKISVPAEILSKPGKLTDIEFGLIKNHPRVGYDILKAIDFPWPVAKIVLQHHERIDGSGYPLGLKGEEILMEARILAVADVVEAMASHRPYRPAFGITRALEEIIRYKGVLYDSDVVDACVKLFTVKGYNFTRPKEEPPLPDIY